MNPTANTQAPARRPRRRNRTILPVAAATLVAFMGMTGFLGAQMAHGQDPLLGSGKKQTAQVQPKVVRKVIVTRKVIIKQAAPAASAGGAAVASSSGSGYSAPVQQSAPVQSAPAPAPVQSAPAPVQSGSS